MSTREFTVEELEENGARGLRPTIRKAFGDLPTGEEVAKRIASKYGVTLGELLGPRRFHYIVIARHELYQALYDLGWSYPAIGAFVGRDHSTIHKVLNVRDGKVA